MRASSTWRIDAACYYLKITFGIVIIRFLVVVDQHRARCCIIQRRLRQRRIALNSDALRCRLNLASQFSLNSTVSDQEKASSGIDKFTNLRF